MSVDRGLSSGGRAEAPVRTTEPPAVIEVQRLGLVPYDEASALQAKMVHERRSGTVSDRLLLLEHPHVITLGTASSAQHVLADDGERRLLGVELHQSGRGGDVTYHGPGQLVGYPILDLKPDRKDLHRYLRDLEEVLLRALAFLGVPDAQRRPGLTGVWLPSGKVAAIGVRVSSGWITSHGFALNVCNDLRYFDTIVPCGIRGERVTSLAEATGRSVRVDDAVDAVVAAFAEVFGRPVVERGSPAGS